MNTVTISQDYTDEKTFYFGLFSDLHLDAKGHDRQQFESDMDYVICKNGRIFVNGDIFDAIMPTDRKRYSRSGDVFESDAQINAKVDYAFTRLKPYADYIDYLGFGNHEVSAVKYNNSDMIAMLARELNRERSSSLKPIARSGYNGFINLSFSRGNGATRRVVIYRDHGKGGNSPVTKGTISLNRLYTTYIADIYWLGHSHVSLVDSKSQWSIGVSSQGNLFRKNKIGIITPGYNRNFDEKNYDKDSDYYELNFAEERFYAPTGIGYGLLEVDLTGDKLNIKASVQ